MACCHQDECPEARELFEMAADPTLQGCCRRDLQQQARAAQIKTSLLAVDPSQVKQKLQQQVISTQPHTEDFDNNSDAGLGALRRLRLQQLQGEAQRHSGLQAAGRGRVLSVADDQLLGRAAEEVCVVCHVSTDGCTACQQLDDHLDTLAHRFLGTAFWRTRLSRHSRLPAALGLPHAPGEPCQIWSGVRSLTSTPDWKVFMVASSSCSAAVLGLVPALALLIMQSGSLIGKAPLNAFGDSDSIFEEQVTSWLRVNKSLCQSAAPTGKRGAVADSAASDSEASAASDSEWQEPCEICGRRYNHEHVRAVYAADGDGDSEGDQD